MSDETLDAKLSLPDDVRTALERVIDYVMTHEERDFWENSLWEEDTHRITAPSGPHRLKDDHVFRHAWVLRRWLWGRAGWERGQRPPAPPAAVVQE